jgi:tetratricopeptide (TPR) repeat protein
MESKNFSGAIKLYTKLISQTPGDFSLFESRAYCRYNLAQYKNAVRDCDTALGFNPPMVTKLYLWNLRGDSYLKLLDYEKAYEDLSMVAGAYYHDPDKAIAMAYTQLMLQRYPQAIRKFKEVLEEMDCSQQNRIDACYYLGVAYLEIDSITACEKYFDRIMALDSTSTDGLYLKAAISSYKGDSNGAILCYTKILLKDSNQWNALFYRGMEYCTKKEFALALNDLDRYALKSKDKELGLYYTAVAYRGLIKYDKALTLFKQRLKTTSNPSAINNEISWTYFLAKKYSEGLPYAHAAIKNDSTNLHAFDTRGAIYYKLGQLELAIKDFNTTLQLDSMYGNSYYYRACCFLKMSKSEKACEDLERALKINNYTLLEGEKPAELLIQENCNN